MKTCILCGAGLVNEDPELFRCLKSVNGKHSMNASLFREKVFPDSITGEPTAYILFGKEIPGVMDCIWCCHTKEWLEGIYEFTL